MQIKRELLLPIAILIFSILACNLPGPGSDGTDTAATPLSVLNTEAVVVENTAEIIPTETPIPPSATASVAAEITLTKNSNCRVGPSTYYNVVDQIAQNKVLAVIGRNDDSTWWQVVNATGRECWIFNENADENTDFSAVQIGEAPSLPGIPGQFFVVDQLCQPGPKKFSVTLSWASGGGEKNFRLFRDGKQLIELKQSKLNYKDASAPLNKNLTYELEAVNENGTSERVIQIVPACK